MDHIFRWLPLRELSKKAPVTTFLVFINLAVFIYGAIAERFLDAIPIVYQLGIIRLWIDTSGEYYRIFTSGFAHFDFIHLAFNVGFGLYLISGGLERLIGSFRFAIAYFVSLLGSGIIVYLFSEPLVTTAGASGAIYGMLGVLLFISINRPGMLSRPEAQAIRNLLFINILFTFLASNISIYGHLGGLVVGLLISYLLIPREQVIEDSYVYNYTVEDDDDEDEETEWWNKH